MSGENGAALAALDNKVETLRRDVSQHLAGVRNDIKDLTAALREMIRLDGEIKRQNDAVGRIGRQVDKQEERLHEIETVRLPALEVGGVKTGVVTESNDRFNWKLISVALTTLGAVVGGLIVYVATH